MKMSKGKRRVGQSPGETGYEHPGVPPSRTGGVCIMLRAAECENTCKMLPTEEVHLGCGVQGFAGRSDLWACGAGWLTSATQTPAPRASQVLTTKHKLLASDQTVRHGPRPEADRHSYQAEYSRLRDHLPGAAKNHSCSQAFLRNVQGLRNPGFLS